MAQWSSLGKLTDLMCALITGEAVAKLSTSRGSKPSRNLSKMCRIPKKVSKVSISLCEIAEAIVDNMEAVCETAELEKKHKIGLNDSCGNGNSSDT